jgi:hypothetical protein
MIHLTLFTGIQYIKFTAVGEFRRNAAHAQ